MDMLSTDVDVPECSTKGVKVVGGSNGPQIDEMPQLRHEITIH